MKPSPSNAPEASPFTFEAVTSGIRVVVTPQFLTDRSDPAERRYFWAYTVEITNFSQETVQLRSRHWRITDGFGRVQEVRGPGVVGEEPIIAPGGRYQYTSGCPLTTPTGFMAGDYQMMTGRGEWLTVAIPNFSLDLPGDRRVFN